MSKNAAAKAQFQRVFSNIRDAVNELELDNLPEIAEFARDRIVTKAQSGRTMASGADKKMPALSESYIEERKRWKRAHGDEVRKLRKTYKQDDFNYGGIGFNQARKNALASGAKDTGEFFSPARSNLTATGQYLESIKVISIDQKRAQIVIGATGPRDGEKITNSKLAEFLSRMGRSIWGLDKVTETRIVKMVTSAIRTKLKKNLLK